MKFKTRITAALAVLLTTVPSHAAVDVALEGAQAGEWTMDLEAAQKIAEKKELPLMLNFTGSDWCGWCKLMDKQVFSHDAWKTFAAKNAMLVTIDFPSDKSKVPEKFQDRNQQLQQALGVRGYPTFVVLDSDGQTILGKLGASQDASPESFIEEFKDVARFSQGALKRFAKTLSADQQAEFNKALASLQGVQGEFEKWIETQPQRSEENDKKFEDFQKRMKAAISKVNEFYEAGSGKTKKESASQ